MKYYATIDADGRRTATYRANHPSIPKDAFEVDEAIFREWINNDQTRRWENGRLVECAPPAPTMEQRISAIKSEASRRIIAIVPEHRQRNLLAQATLLLRKGDSNWTAEERAEWESGQAIWERVEAIRAASNQMEAEIAAGGEPITDWPEG